MNTRHIILSAAVLLTAALALTACAPPAEVPATTPTLEHVHEVAFRDTGRLLVASHHGVYAVDLGSDRAELVGGADFDAMGLAPADDAILVSGHPGPESDAAFVAPNIGLMAHSSTGWRQVSLAGITDFHALATTPAAPGLVLGLPSDRPALVVSVDGGTTWTEKAALEARDLAADAADPRTIVATTADGVVVSRDGGETFTPLPGAPALVVVAADPTGRGGLVGVDTSGAIWRGTTEPDARWSVLGQAQGTATAIAAASDGTIAIADERGIAVTHAGEEWRVVL